MTVRILVGNCRTTLASLEAGSVQTCVTSPPYYGLRSYLPDGHADKSLELGTEQTPDAYVAALVAVFREVKRVLRDDGTLWLNLGDSFSRAPEKGGSGPNGKNSDYSDSYTIAQSARVGSSDGAVGRGDRPGSRASGLPAKNLLGIPWRVAFALQADGWYLRSDIIWAKPNPMPESVTDRPTKSHEYIFLLSKSPRYYYDADAIAEPAATGWNGSTFDGERDLAVRPNTGRQPRFGGTKYGDSDGPSHRTKSGNEYAPNGKRNKRTVWTVATQPFKGAHFATFPPALIEPCILAGSSPQACEKCGAPWARKPTCGHDNAGTGKCTILDPFGGAGTVGLVADRHGRNAILCELNPEYAAMAEQRITSDSPMFAEVATD